MVINSKRDIILNLDKVYLDLIDWLENQPDSNFEKRLNDKWSTSQHVSHLIKSSQPINQALRLPKFVLKTFFGENNRVEKNYEQVVNKYKSTLEKGGKAAGRFLPKNGGLKYKEKWINQLIKEKDKLNKIIGKWNEDQLKTYVLPHPLIGKMTINEMLYFTIFHVSLHLDILKRDYSY